MSPRSLHLVVRTACLAILVAVLAGCGTTYTAAPTTTALEKKGWTAIAAKGGTVSKVEQTAFLELTSPDGHEIDVR